MAFVVQANEPGDDDASVTIQERREAFAPFAIVSMGAIRQGVFGWKNIGRISSGTTDILMDSNRWFVRTTRRQSTWQSVLSTSLALSFGAAFALWFGCNPRSNDATCRAAFSCKVVLFCSDRNKFSLMRPCSQQQNAEKMQPRN